MTSQHSVLVTQHSAYVWHILHCRWHRTHTITPNQSIYNVTSTSGMTTQPLYQISHPLYLCHHTVSTDISPTFVWHHTHLLCGIIWTIYNFTTNPYVNHTTGHMTTKTLYMEPHPVWGQHIHLTWYITATIWFIIPLYRQHHTHSFYDHKLAICVASCALYKTSHSHFLTSKHQLRTSHPLY